MAMMLLHFTALAQLAVTATGTNGTCVSDAKITATATGNTGVVSYQLLQGTTVIRAYQASNIFENLPAGSYTVKAEDIATSNTATSGSVTLTTSYQTMVVSIPTTQVGCATATNGTLTATVTKGKSPYIYSISPDPNSVGTQSSNVFSNLPVGGYTISVTDACGTTVTQGSSVSSTSTTAADIMPPYGGAYFTWGNFQNGELNDCSRGAFVNTYGWSYKSTNGGLNTFDINHFYWRYEYPSGSGNIYGAGGALNGPMVPLTTRSIPAPAGAAYPFADGDIIIYDECGNSYRNVKYLWQSTATSTPQQGTGNRARALYDCDKGGGVTMQFLQYETICAPVTYTFTDNLTSAVITQVLTNNASVTKYGFTPGHTYTVVALDALGHNATTTTSLTIPTSTGNVTLYNTQKTNQYRNASTVSINYPFEIPANTPITYEVVASNNAAIPVGYARTYTYSTIVNSYASLYGHPTYGGGAVWPAGTYTLKFNIAPCVIDSYLTFTVPPGFNGDLNGTNTIIPTCGAFNVGLQATLDNPSGYQVKVISGPSNINAVRGFNTTAVSAGTYNSISFDGLTYGTYTIGLVISGSNSPIATQTITYTATNALIIDALATGGYVCAGDVTGSLTVSASSASGSALQYSKDDGVSWQASNVFTGVAIGNYPVKVKDACGNIVSYNASVVGASGITASASSTTPCAESSVQLSVNAIGATSYSWVGPNGFTSSLQNPTINNITAAANGTYTVTVTSPSCTNVASVNITVNALPTASIAYTAASFCATGTVTPTITGTTGGTFSATSGLNIDAATGAIDLATSVAGTYTVTYTFSNATCSNTTTATVAVKALPLVVTTAQAICAPGTIDLTAAAVTAGSTAGLTFTYYTDAAGTTPLANPNAVVASGTYYIQGYLASTGCYSKITSVAVNIQAKPNLVINNPATVCGGTVDLTAAAVTSGSDANLSFAYYTDAAGTAVLSNPTAVATSGTYYIQATSTVTSCRSDIKPVVVSISALVAPTVTTTAATCAAIGTATVSNYVSTNTYTFSPSGPTVGAGGVISGMAAGTSYTVVANNGSCTSVVSAGFSIQSMLASPVAPAVTVTAATCSAAGTATVSNYVSINTYTFSPSGPTVGAGGVISGMSAGTSYTVVANNGSCTSVVSASFSIQSMLASPVAPTITVTAATCSAAGAATVSNYVSTNTYAFSPSGPTVGAGGVISGMAAGTSYTVVANNGSCTSVASAGFSIQPMLASPVAPTVTVTAATCSAAGTAMVSNYVSTSTYTFSPSGPTVGAGGVISGMAAGTSYTVVANNGSCTSVASASFSIQSMLATPTANISYGTGPFQAIGNLSVNQTGQTGGTYTASPAGLAINATTGAINLAGSTPNQTYTVTYSFNNGSCSGTATATVKVNSTPATIAYANPSYCATGTVAITQTGPTGGTYEASATGLKLNETTGTVNLAASTSGSYTVTYTYQDGTITATATTAITVNAMPVLSLNSSLGTTISKGDMVVLTATGGIVYNWMGADIQSGQGTSELTVRPKQTTTYTVTVSNASGCSEVRQITITVKDDYKLKPNNVITPNGDGKNDFWVIENIDYYPNNTVKIFDRAGRLVYSKKGYNNEWDGTYNGNYLNEDAYFYVIDMGNGIGIIRGTISIIRDQR